MCSSDLVLGPVPGCVVESSVRCASSPRVWFSNGDPVETGAVIFQSQGAEDHPISLDLLIMSDGTCHHAIESHNDGHDVPLSSTS